MKFFDAFAGIGGFRLGMERAGHECVGGAEIDKYARGIYEHRFGRSEHHHGDIRAIDPAKLPDFDCIVGGFPCQAFSISGRRGGFSDTRGTLFFEIARIAKAKAPHTMLLENVKGLLSHDGGWTFWTILRTLDELGYDASWQVLNSVARVPQNRERVFIVARSRAKRFREVFPIEESYYRNSCTHEAAQGEEERLRGEHSDGDVAGTVRPGTRGARGSTIVNCLDACYSKGGGSRTLLELTDGLSDAHRIYDTEGVAKTLKGEAGGQGAKTGLYLIRKNMKGKDSDRAEEKYVDCGDAAATLMAKPDHNPKVVYEPTIVQSNQRREVVSKSESGAVNQSMSSNQAPRVLTEDSRIRRLTPPETERLQGFPEVERMQILTCRIIKDSLLPHVDAEAKCFTGQSNVVSVGGEGYLRSVCPADLNSGASPLDQGKLVDLAVRINYAQNLLQVRNAGKLILSVSLVGKESQLAQPILLGNTALQFVSMLTVEERIIRPGKAALLKSTTPSTPRKNGKKSAGKSGQESGANARSAIANTSALAESIKCITLEAEQNSQNSGWRTATLPCSVIDIINSFIPVGTGEEDLFSFALETVNGWTAEGVFDGKIKKISDSQRYRCTGNAVTVDVIEEIAKRL